MSRQDESFDDLDPEDETKECPFCGAEMHELADVCPRCGMWYQRRARRPRLAWVVIVVVAIAFILMYFLGLWHFL
jgi:hypothetical protein